MKKVYRIISILMIILLLTSCSFLKKEGGSPFYYGKRYDLFRLALNSFPGLREGRGARIDEKTIETDDYGREIYVIVFPFAGWYYNDTIEADSKLNAAYVISQGRDDKKVYYYEDICFKLFDDKKGIEPDLIDELKEENDWNKPLQPDKCSSRLHEDDYAGMKNLNDFYFEACKRMRAVFGEDCGCTGVTADANGYELYGVYTKKEDKREFYLVIYQPDRKIDIENCVMKVESFDFGKELHEFKIRNGWNFTDCPGEKVTLSK